MTEVGYNLAEIIMDPISSRQLSTFFFTDSSVEAPPEKTEIISTGWAADELLKRLLQQDSAEAIDLHELMEEEIIYHLADPALFDKSDGIGIPTAQGMQTRMEISLTHLITAIFEQLKKTQPGRFSRPELIGGSVPRLLGKRFYIAYLQKKLGITEAHAERLAAPFLATIRNKPNDYDFRQWIEDGTPAGGKNGFKEQFATALFRIIEQCQGPATTIQELKARGFRKLNYIHTDALEYGMASLGSFGGAPLDCIIMYKTNRPYLFTKDGAALTFRPEWDLYGELHLNPKLVVHDLPGTALSQETIIAHQLAMVLDTPSYEGLNGFGWHAAMALTTKGWRTLKPDFFPRVWEAFCKEYSITWLEIEKAMHWIESNHLPKDKPSAKLALRFNLLIFLIDHVNNLDPLIVKKLLEQINFWRAVNKEAKLYHFSQLVLSSLLEMLESSTLPPAATLGWFRIGLGLCGLKNGFYQEAISTNYGTAAYRLCIDQLFTMWLPLHLPKALCAIQNTQSIASLMKPLLNLIQYPLINSGKAVALDIFHEKWVQSLLKFLKQSRNADFLKIALFLEKEWIRQGKQMALNPEWHRHVPALLETHPQELSALKGPLGLNLRLELKTILSPLDWILHLAAAPHTLPYSVEAIDRLDRAGMESLKQKIRELRPALFFVLYRHLRHIEGLFEEQQVQEMLYDFLKDLLPPDLRSLPSSEGCKLVPWTLFLLNMKGRHESFLITQEFLVKGDLKIPLNVPAVMRQALSIEDQENCLKIFLHHFQQEMSDLPDLHKLALDILLQIKRSPDEEMAIEWLEYLPELIGPFPLIGALLKERLPEPFQKWIENKDRDIYDWILLLLVDDRENFRKAGGRLWRMLPLQLNFLDRLKNFLLQHKKKIPSCLKAHGCLDFNEPPVREFLKWCVQVTALNPALQRPMVEYLEQTFPQSFSRKPRESDDHFLVRTIQDLSVIEDLQAVQKCDEPEWKTLSDQSRWISLMEQNSSVFILSFLLSIPYSNMQIPEFQNRIALPVLQCQQAITFNQVLFGEIKNKLLKRFCNQDLVPYSPLVRKGINYTVHFVAVTSLMFFGALIKHASTHLQPKTTALDLFSPRTRSILSKIVLVAVLLAVVRPFSEPTQLDNNAPFTEQCLREVKSYFAQALQQAEWRDLGSTTHLLKQLQKHLCKLEPSETLSHFHSLFTLLSSLGFGLFVPFNAIQQFMTGEGEESSSTILEKAKMSGSPDFGSKTVRRNRIWSITQSLAQGTFLISGALYSQYNYLAHARKDCLIASNYTLAILGETRKVSFCPKTDEEQIRNYFISFCALNVLMAAVHFLYGRHFHLKLSSRLHTWINRQTENTPLSSSFAIRVLKTPMLKMLPWITISLIVSHLFKNAFNELYPHPCMRTIGSAFPESMTCEVAPLPAGGATPPLLAQRLCTPHNSIYYDLGGLVLAYVHFFLAGLLSTPIARR